MALPIPTGTRPRLRAAGLASVLVLEAVLFGWIVNAHYPIQHWLFWHYAACWVAAAALTASCASAGHAVMTRFFGDVFGVRAHAVMSLATGFFLFFLLMMAGGLLHLYGPVFFVAVPLLLGAIGARSVMRTARRWRRIVTHARSHAAPALRPWWSTPWAPWLLGFGVVGLVLVYVPILTPDNVAYDSRWYHMAMAEHYVAQGGVERFREGWFLGAYPQLASFLYSWAFQLPGRRLFDQVELASHLEFVVFLWTLFSIPALTQLMLRGRRSPLAWVALFLFPAIFLYDASLTGAADHVAAFWAVPIYLATERAWRQLDVKRCALLAVMMAGAVMTKYSALGLVLFPAAAIAVRTVIAIVRTPGPAAVRLRWLAGPAAAVGTALLVTTPHWLKNWIWYGDPLYPFLHKRLHVRPWTVDSADRFGHFTPTEWSAPHTAEGVKQTVEALFTHSFKPNDWPAFHGQVPVFGSLFTLTLFCLPFLPRARRLWALYAATHVAIASWYWTFHQDRYLQAMLPWMAAGVAAVLISIWRLGWLPRATVVGLVGLQLAWGGDVPFIPGHAMVGGSPLKTTVDFLASGYRKNYKERLRPYGMWSDVRDALPPRSKVLLHEEHGHLGLGAPAVSDWIGWQGGISYGRDPSAASVDRLLRGLGVTHLLWTTGSSRGYDSMAGDIAFFSYVLNQGDKPRIFGNHTLAAMPSAPPPAAPPGQVAYLGCGETYATGLYDLGQLTVTTLATPRPRTDFPAPREPVKGPEGLAGRLGSLEAVVIKPSCFPGAPDLARAGFVQAATRHEHQIWVRSRRPH